METEDCYDLSHYRVLQESTQERHGSAIIYHQRGDVQHIPTRYWITFNYCDTEEEWKDWMSVIYCIPDDEKNTMKILEGAKMALTASGISMARETLLSAEEWDKYKRNYVDFFHPENPNKFGYNVVPDSWWRKLWNRLRKFL